MVHADGSDSHSTEKPDNGNGVMLRTSLAVHVVLGVLGILAAWHGQLALAISLVLIDAFQLVLFTLGLADDDETELSE